MATASPIARLGAPSPGRSYWQLSRAPRYSLLFALPLLLLYEALAALLADPSGAGVRNGADVILKSGFVAIAGAHGQLVFAAAIVGVSIWFIVRDLRRNRGGLRWGVFLGMLAESAVLAAAFGIVVGTATAQLLGQLRLLGDAGAPASSLLALAQPGLDAPTRLMVSLGAGLYEELLFRVVLVSGLIAVGRRVLGLGQGMAVAMAVVLGALIFSAFHYIGPYGDPLRLDSFTFRAIAGLAFSGLYVARGFGITAWTHALYDVFLLLV